MADTVLTDLKIHDFDSLAQMSQYESEIGDNDLVFTPDLSCRLPLLTPMWFDHQVNDESWLNADTFSWQPSDRYKQTYEHLANDINGKVLQSEAVGDITVQFYLADDGHKICPASEESNLIALYEATGVAWYYILDTENKQFKLPRTKWGFNGLRDSVGGYVAPGLPNITGTFSGSKTASGGRSGAFYKAGTVGGAYPSGTSTEGVVEGFSANLSNPTYQDGATVQPPATQMYLYFYVGNFEQSAVEQTAGINAEMFNGKADRNLLNTTDNVDIVVESQLPTSANGYTWYRKYKSGWVEQGGYKEISTGGSATISLPIAMVDTNYSAQMTPASNTSGASPRIAIIKSNLTTTTITLNWYSYNDGQAKAYWQVSGMSA